MRRSTMMVRPRRLSEFGGWLCMPMVKNVPEPKHGKGWKKVKCPECGRECWQRPEDKDAIANCRLNGAVCTECALAK